MPQPAGMRLGRARISSISTSNTSSISSHQHQQHHPYEEKQRLSGVRREISMGDQHSEEVSAPAPAVSEVSEAPAADNASSSVWANVKKIFNIRFNPLSGEALSRMYQQQPAQRIQQQQHKHVAAAPTAAPAARCSSSTSSSSSNSSTSNEQQ